MIRVDRFLLRKRAYPALLATLDLCRQLYNAALEQRILAYRRQGKSLSLYDQQKDLTALRAVDPSLKTLVVEMTRLTVLDRLDKAFKAFFRRCKAGGKPGFPRFRGKNRFDTLIFGVEGWSFKGNRLHLRGIGSFSVVGKRVREGEIKGLRIKQVADRWEVQVIVDVGQAPAVRPSTHGVGIDVGIKTFATMSDGERIEHPGFLKRSLGGLKIAQQAVSSKRKGSNRRSKAKMILQRLHRRITNQRQNFLHQTTRRLVKTYDGFAVEKLQIQEMAQQSPEDMTPKRARGLHRGIMDSAWSTFMFQLGYKAEEAGRPMVKVDPKGTSQRCSGCGSVVRKTLRDRQHACPACGLVLDRDLNAAVNIKHLGWRCADDPVGCTTNQQGYCEGSQ